MSYIVGWSVSAEEYPPPMMSWGPWHRTPRWMLWRKPWRRYSTVIVNGITQWETLQYADHADFLTM